MSSQARLILLIALIYFEENARAASPYSSRRFPHFAGAKQTNQNISASVVEWYLTDNLDMTIKPCDDFFKHVCGEFVLHNDTAAEKVYAQQKEHDARIVLKSTEKAMEYQSSLWFEKFLHVFQQCNQKKQENPFEKYSVLLNYGERLIFDGRISGIMETLDMSVEALVGTLYYNTGNPTFMGHPFVYAGYDEPHVIVKHDAQNVEQERRLAAKFFYKYSESVSKLLRSENITLALDSYLEMDRAIFDAPEQKPVYKNESTLANDERPFNITEYVWFALFPRGEVPEYILRKVMLSSKLHGIGVDKARHIAKTIRSYSKQALRQYLFIKVLIDYTRTDFSLTECYDLVLDQMEFAATRLVIDEEIGQKGRLDIKTIVSNIMGAYRESIRKQFHDIPELRNHLEMKLTQIHARIGWPDWVLHDASLNDWYRDLHLETSMPFPFTRYRLWQHHTRSQVRLLKQSYVRGGLFTFRLLMQAAFFNRGSHKYRLYTGMMLPPAYYPSGPAVMSFGAVGYVIGHELGHAFDFEGVQLDYKGENVKGHASQAMLEYFRHRKNSSCLNSHYGKFYPISSDRNEITARTLEENQADLLGARMALEGYKRWAKSQGSRPQPTGRSLSVSEGKVFFMSMTKLLCKKKPSMRHSPAPIRINAMLRQMKEFQDAFKCKNDTSMIPRERRCSVW